MTVLDSRHGSSEKILSKLHYRDIKLVKYLILASEHTNTSSIHLMSPPFFQRKITAIGWGFFSFFLISFLMGWLQLWAEDFK